MQVLEEVAKILHRRPQDLERESLRNYLEDELRKIESEIYKIGSKHGIKSVVELEAKLKKGKLKEEEMADDFMELDHLEFKKDEIIKALRKF